MAFDEDVLLDQDRFLSAVLARPEFQKKMTGTELRYLLGAYLRPRRSRTAFPMVCSRLVIGWQFRYLSGRRRMAAYS